EEIIEFAKSKSKSYSSGPWQTDFDSMAKKTVIKQLLKYAPLSIELQKAMVGDETIKSEIDEDMSMVVDESESLEVDFEVKENMDGKVSVEEA
ncbi:TPA: recombinase RecT, partial [Clostridioides difficile]|nr:recombinase RecT [Clostridioides difficile]